VENQAKEKLSLRKQSAWLLFAKVIGFGFAFLLPLLTVRLLTQEKVGIYRQVFQIIANAATVLPLGISMSAYYFLARETGARRSAAVLNILIFNFVVGGIACLTLYFYPQLAGNIFQSEEITRLSPKIGVVIWLWIISTFLETVAVANQEARMATAFIILAQFSKTVLMVGAVVFFTSVEAFVFAAIVQGVLQTVVLFIYLNSRFPRLWFSFNPTFFREQLFYALPFGLAGLLWVLQTDIHNYFVGYRFTDAEYAIYTSGCFELPLIAMLADSVSSVLIPRMSELQAKDEKREMIRVLTRTMQKLAFFYFPIYVFLLITAHVFITMLFTRDYEASVPIFLINITLLPFLIWTTDPVVRAYKELGRMQLILRIFTLIALVSALYYGVQSFDLRGMIAIVVVTSLLDRLIATVLVLKKLEVEKRDIYLLKDIGKTAVMSLIAGAATFLFYNYFWESAAALGASFTSLVFSAPKQSILDFVSGGFVLAFSALVFVPIYLCGMNLLGVIDEEEKDFVRNFITKFSNRFRKTETISKRQAIITDN
jgi:O-antigen/teichoic acid export membrane protein